MENILANANIYSNVSPWVSLYIAVILLFTSLELRERGIANS